MSKTNVRRLSLVGTSLLAIILGWLVLFPYRKLPFLGTYAPYLGKNPSIHLLIIVGLAIYLHLNISRPQLARESTQSSISALKTSLPNVLGALLIAGAAVQLIPGKLLASLLGEQAGLVAVFSGVSIGALLPACPFISYPIIGALYSAGAGFNGVMALLFGAGLGFICTISADLTFFNLQISVLRIVLSWLAAITAGLLFFFAGTYFG